MSEQTTATADGGATTTALPPSVVVRGVRASYGRI